MVAFIEPGASVRLRETPSQTAGPYVHIGLIPSQAGLDIFGQDLGRVLAGPDAAGERILHRGPGARRRRRAVHRRPGGDSGRPTPPGATTTRPTSQDKPLDPGVPRLGPHRARISAPGSGASRPSSPAPSSGRHGRPMAPHVNIWLASRGMNIGLSTRMYFPDEAAANATDPVLGIVGHVTPRHAGGTAGGAGRDGGLRVRHPSARRAGNRVLRRLSKAAMSLPPVGLRVCSTLEASRPCPDL